MASVKMQGNRGRENRGTREQRSEERATLTSKDSSMGTPVACAAAPPEKPKRKWRGNGAAKLKKAADRAVAENSEELAKLLLKDALKGKMESARLLVTLSEKKEQLPARRRRGQSWAEKLTAEPEWDPTRDDRHGGLTAADLKGSEEDWENETAEAMENRERGSGSAG
jgi:hypothetical protein